MVLPQGKPGQVLSIQDNGDGSFTLVPVKPAAGIVEVLEVEDLDRRTLAPKERGQVSDASIREAIRQDRDSR